MASEILPGQSFPLGATVFPGGVNFCLFSRNAVAVELLLFDDVDASRPERTLWLDPHRNRTFYYWHVFVPGLYPGQLYAYRAYGPWNPGCGHRFNPQKVLLDPYALAVGIGRSYERLAAVHPGDNCRQALKGVIVDPSQYRWEGDLPLGLPYSGSVIYELHIGNFTRNPNSGVAPERRGTYAGLIEKLPYLKSLGVTAIELLPVQQFDDQDLTPPFHNVWGYNPIAFFAPHQGYCTARDPLAPVNEFRDLIKAVHRAGIEVILDVVFNHTAEGGNNGPMFSFRGLENRAYYILESNPVYYANYSGCGNTVNANHSVVRRMILDCLRYWVAVMHVDGFRFDLASVMSRDESGRPLKSPPILWEIESDPVLAGTKIIAEAWDAAGLYQVGSFIGHRWAEWNGKFRDDVRRFVKSDSGFAGALAARITASPDLYPQPDREPNRSINFITCHDGFTLRDLVSYNERHNEANCPGMEGGTEANFSWNCGVEGETTDPQILALRSRQVKNFFTLLLVSQGTPMILMGDEIGRSQSGNNNAYCLDNEQTWFDWDALAQEVGLLRFVRGMIQFTQSRQVFQEERFWALNGESPHIIWHGVHLGLPDWGQESHTLAFSLQHEQYGELIHVMVNAYWEPLDFELPFLAPGDCWYRIVDTAHFSPDDFSEPENAPEVESSIYHVEARSIVVLLAPGGAADLFFSI